ncbi:YcaO-like family protein [Nonomuraea sp. NPDC049421]|uniref:YcaO-like family protein n=1 Tax=Nonomuraea sp. NPDC049421 TaxID=3155275 RepID=UPI00343D57E9
MTETLGGPPRPRPPVADALEAMVSPLGGLVGSTSRLLTPETGASLPVHAAALGDTTQVLPAVADAMRGRPTNGTIDGAAASLDEREARWLAVAEALERYSSSVYSEDQFVWATAAELGDEALDLDTVPSISDAEAAHPACPLVKPDKLAPMRWVRGLSLMTSRPAWIPVPYVYLHLRYASEGERLTAPISTGCAAHTDVHTALAKALCEVIERDAIVLTWLQRLPLPRLDLDRVSDELALLTRIAREEQVVTHLFDATTDLGVPTVYLVEVAPHHPATRTLVTCATDPDPYAAAEKVFREAASCRIGLRSRVPERTDPMTFRDPFDGGTYMAAPERAHAFGFLLDSPHRRSLSELPAPEVAEGRPALRWILQRLRDHGMEAFAVDLTCDEARDIGMSVVRVIVPRLMPLSFVGAAQYRGTPRLYEAPVAMGYPAHAEADLNPWPQPFV